MLCLYSIIVNIIIVTFIIIIAVIIIIVNHAFCQYHKTYFPYLSMAKSLSLM